VTKKRRWRISVGCRDRLGSTGSAGSHTTLSGGNKIGVNGWIDCMRACLRAWCVYACVCERTYIYIWNILYEIY